ncbi:FAD-binding oxidoreductase [Desulfospira joergensenii]|uniref:FAD-binding oxidoreductase n=1 Tax=Desulfospira joergensenii TaxID=53329 RepID=UPI0003B6EC71|nr:FAD-binding oxidoreductase [Desulfospira joergensenii]
MTGMPSESKVDSKITKKLREIVGENNATDYKHIRYAYSYDLSFVSPKLPEYVVMPTSVEQVQEVMKFANQEKISVTPFTAGTNIGGLCIPENGGILLDMKRMNQIIRIDDESHYCVIEPGVSHAKLASELAKLGLRWSWPVGPPSASVSSNAICHGIGGLSGRYGLNSEEITSMEVVLPTGELVRVGSCAIQEDSWHSCLPLPRVDGLFTGWLGTTGIVTKIGLRVHPMPPVLKVFTASAENIGDLATYMRTLGNYEICDDITGVSWWLSQVPIPYPYKPKPDDAPEWVSFATTFSWTEKEKQAREEIWQSIMDEQTKNGSSVKSTVYPEEALRARTQLPSQIVGSTKNYTKQAGAGISWPGTFTPLNKWEPVYEQWKKILVERNLSPSVRVTNYRGVHYGMLRAMIPFPKKTPETIENARQAIVECLKVDLDAGGIPYKPPVDFGLEINKRAHPGYVELLRKTKKMLDPNDIMNTGKLAL